MSNHCENKLWLIGGNVDKPEQQIPLLIEWGWDVRHQSEMLVIASWSGNNQCIQSIPDGLALTDLVIVFNSFPENFGGGQALSVSYLGDCLWGNFDAPERVQREQNEYAIESAKSEVQS